MSVIKKKLAAIDRRTFLKGMLNTSISLPVMDFMLNSSGTAYAQGQPLGKTYLSFFNGSTGPDYLVTPTNTGNLANISLRNVTKNLFNKSDYSEVLKKMSIVSNLYLPMRQLPGGVEPVTLASTENPGYAATRSLHGEGHIVQFTGIDFNAGNYRDSFDVLLAKANNIPIDNTIYFSVQRNQTNAKVSTLRFDKSKENTSDGNHTKYSQPYIKDLTDLLGKYIFSSSSATNNSDIQALAEKQQKSILDYMDNDRMNYLKKILPQAAQIKLDQQQTIIREAELSVDSRIFEIENSSTVNSSTCNKPEISNGGDELHVVESMLKIFKAGAICGTHKVGLIPITLSHSELVPTQILKNYNINLSSVNYHDLSHAYERGDHMDAHAAMLEWHYDIFLRTAKTYNEIKVGAGTFLDQSILSLSNEGGWGDETYKDQSPHAGINMYASYITGTNGLKTGQHIRPGSRKHMCEFHLSLMRQFGYNGKLGVINKTISEIQS